jgi:hypothetical protein
MRGVSLFVEFLFLVRVCTDFFCSLRILHYFLPAFWRTLTHLRTKICTRVHMHVCIRLFPPSILMFLLTKRRGKKKRVLVRIFTKFQDEHVSRVSAQVCV